MKQEKNDGKNENLNQPDENENKRIENKVDDDGEEDSVPRKAQPKKWGNPKPNIDTDTTNDMVTTNDVA